ncbi:MAG: CBS domain-containing protein [Thermoproteus sp.]
MKALDLARKAPLIRLGDKLVDAAKAVLEGCDCVVVVDGDDVVGVVGEDDIVRAVARGATAYTPLAEVLTSPPLLVEGFEPLWKVAEAMLATGLRVAVVTVGGRFAGVISAGDIADGEGQLREASSFAEAVLSASPPA